LFVIGLIGCNNPEQNFSFRSGDSLLIEGPQSLTIPDSANSVQGIYHSDYATIKKDYNWSVTDDATIDSTFDYNGLQVAISFPEKPDTTVYTVSVDDGTHQGSIDVSVAPPSKK
jgi:hypothetical protein